MRQYKLTYSRKVAGGHRIIAYNQVVNESDFVIIASDCINKSRYEYIIIKAELLDYDVLDLDSINYVMSEGE
jgi:hypothetical protein